MIRKWNTHDQWVLGTEKRPFEHAMYRPEPIECGSGSADCFHAYASAMALVGGSGSRWDDAIQRENIADVVAVRKELSAEWEGVFLVYPGPHGAVAPEPLTVGEQLAQIRDIFGISTAALADILRAARASVYNWLEDTKPPSASFSARIADLHSIALEWQGKNPYHFAPGRLMKQALDEGPSMLDRLCRDQLDLAEIHTGMDCLAALMRKHRERMNKSNKKAAKLQVSERDRKETLERLVSTISSEP